MNKRNSASFLKRCIETKEAQVLLKNVRVFQLLFPSGMAQHLTQNHYIHLQECKFGGNNNNNNIPQIGMPTKLVKFNLNH